MCGAVAPYVFSQHTGYQLELGPEGSVTIQAGTQSRTLRPKFTVLSSETDPKAKQEKTAEENFMVPAWARGGPAGGTTRDLFQSATAASVGGVRSAREQGRVRWQFPEQKGFVLEASIETPSDGSEPVLSFRFTPKRDGWYSVGYTGAPEIAPSQADEIWQPLIWQEKRFPRMSFLSTEHMCPLPAVFVTERGSTFGIAADPREVPFRLPTFDNSRFGVAVRNQAGQAQPMLFAPVLGKTGSLMKAGETFEFRMRVVLHAGGWFDTYQATARSLFGFHDYRKNGAVSLNETLSNMIDYAMNDAYSGWVSDLRGFDYTLDVPGSVKVVSALHPLSLALVRDDPAILERRARPVAEYLMSRAKYLFGIRENVKGQNASHALDGPSAEVSELAALYDMTRGRSTVFRDYAELLNKKPRRLNLEMVSAPGAWQNMLGLYRMTGNPEHLAAARKGADAYIERRIDTIQADFEDVHVKAGGQFWSDFAPKWIDLLELYEETKEKRYLAAATAGAKEYTGYCWLQPSVPEGGRVLVNRGGLAPLTDFTKNLTNPQRMSAPEQKVEAWAMSQIGLTPEAANTYNSNPAVMLTHYAPYFLRLAYYTGEKFFHDLGRSAVIGRYASFPGYDINVEYSSVYQRKDYPLHPYNQMTYNNIYYNHVWPHIALVVDYLASEAYTRSAGAIEFPARYAQGYAYLQSKVYGDRPGKFYGDADGRFWMPDGVVRIDSPQLNYVSGYGNGNFYLGLMNESAEGVTATVTLNRDYLPYDVTRTYQVQTWQEGKPARGLELRDGTMKIDVPGRGLTGIRFAGMPVFTKLHRDYFDMSSAPLSAASHTVLQSELGKVTGMMMSFGKDMTSAYVWLQADDKRLREARLHYLDGETWKEARDTSFPFDFTVPIAENQQSFAFWVEGTDVSGKVVRTAEATLRR